MKTIQEFSPKKGWRAHYRRKAIVKKVKSTIMALVAFAVYAAAVTLAETI